MTDHTPAPERVRARARTRAHPWRDRRVLAGLALLLVALVAVVVVQVRAQQAEDERARLAAVAAEAAAQAERAELSLARTALEEARAGHDAAVTELATLLAAVTEQRAEGAQLLTDSAGEVADDAVRDGLAQALDVLDAEVARAAAALEAAQEAADDDAASDGSATAEDVDAQTARLSEAVRGLPVDDLTTAAAGLEEATAAVAQSREAWEDEQAARAAEEEEEKAATAESSGHPSGLGGPPSTGAGPDCGGPESREPPKNDGSPVFYTSTPSTSGDGSNGRMPRSSMAPLAWCTDSQGNQQWLRADAAAALTRLNEEFRAEFGENIAVDLSYRSYEDQVEMREWYGSVAARPGTSNHGLGTAFDVWEWRAYGFGSARYRWLVENAPRFGWVAPGWARENGSNPEYWHFEYTG
ncbi:peptidase M15 [Cellulomonas sp. APG4]|uniref:M15 family metallopeptidase n=1 Tax=Cellulomonas sp. APG4 TaxID=1538656 RepID=UPI0013793BFC|nr:M15 family metallopeptidase [Cellulomonas sp. APG4]NCT92284.1 peptidase M15 [Cellulomonas sp. APG4]